MPSATFCVPLPENLDEELAMEDQRLQKRRAVIAAAGGASSSKDGAEGLPVGRTSTDARSETNNSSFAPALNNNSDLGGAENGATGAATKEEEPDVFADILFLTLAASTGLPAAAAAGKDTPGAESADSSSPSSPSRGASLQNLKSGATDPASPSSPQQSLSRAGSLGPGSPGSPFGSPSGQAGAGPSPSTSEMSPFQQLAAALKGPESGSGGGRPMGRVRMRDVRSFCNFLYPGKKQSFNIRVSDQSRGSDLVEATIKAFLAADDRLRGKMSEDFKDYKLFIADDQTGEEEFPVNLEGQPGKCTTVALQALPGAFLTQFPSSKELLPMCHDDVPMVVDIKGAKNTRSVMLPPDLTVERLEEYLTEKLRLLEVQKGSVGCKYGPSTIALNQGYGFGAGGEKSEPPPLKTRTILSLYRFGVKELVISAKLMDDAPPAPVLEDPAGEGGRTFRKIDEEEAKTYRQFEVTKTNKFGAKQERILGVDKDRIYNMKPGSQLGKTKNPERNVADILNIKTFPDRPCYFEIEYIAERRQDTDRIECRNKLDCALLTETLRVLKKISERSVEQKKKEEKGFFTKLFGK